MMGQVHFSICQSDEMANILDSKSSAARLVGSSPTSGTKRSFLLGLENLEYICEDVCVRRNTKGVQKL